MKLTPVALALVLLVATSIAAGQSHPDRKNSTPGIESSQGGGTGDREARAIQSIEDVLNILNGTSTVKGREESKSYRLLFDAYLDMTAPPKEVGTTFNQGTIHARMPEWNLVSGWAESNRHMAEAILASQDKSIIGLPYGIENVPATYRENGISVDLVRDGQLGQINFGYFTAMNTISAFATAEIYRLMETDRTQDALDLATAHLFVLRQFCDRDTLEEKIHSIEMLSEALANLRDVFFVYLDQISLRQFREFAFRDIPYLRPDRNRLFMPEADRVISEARIRLAFDERSGQADPEIFTNAFAQIQSKGEPLMRFGAARRWQMISTIHGSLDASLERLNLIYDDWWRRWRIESYDPILEIPTEFSRCNPVRYAAVLYSMRNIESLFGMRNQLIAQVNGTTMAAGLCGYKKTFKTYPRETGMTYAYSVRKGSDSDPHDYDLRKFRYWLATQRMSMDTSAGRLWIEKGEGLLYSLGQDHLDNRASQHSDDGVTGDVVLWPPVKALQRRQDLID